MKKTKKSKTIKLPAVIRQELRDLRAVHFLFLTVAGIINAIGVTMFLYPVKLYDSGISGTSMLLDQITPDHYELSMLLDQVTPPYLTLPLFLAALNVPVFAFGLKRQGAAFTVYSLFAVCCYSLMSYLIMYVLPIDVAFVSPLAGTDLLLCAIFGGVISGIGSGLTIRCGGAIDGVDVLSVIFAKKLSISLGSFVMIINTVLYIICGIGIQSWILPLYSIVTYFVGSKTVDFIVEGFDRSKCAMIVTTKAEEISEALASGFHAGGTIISATGGYSKSSKQILYFVVNHFQINRLKNIVLSVDENAFISLMDVSDIIKKHGNTEKKTDGKEEPAEARKESE